MTIQSMAEAIKARDEGVSSSAEHAEADTPGWGERAYQALHGHFILNPYWPATIETARLLAGVEDPPDKRAFGAVTQRLIRYGIIEPVGYAKAASSNGSPKRTYRLVKP